MRYPWVALTICGVWIATLALSFSSSTSVDATLLYIYASVTVILLFFLGFTRS